MGVVTVTGNQGPGNLHVLGGRPSPAVAGQAAYASPGGATFFVIRFAMGARAAASFAAAASFRF